MATTGIITEPSRTGSASSGRMTEYAIGENLDDPDDVILPEESLAQVVEPSQEAVTEKCSDLMQDLIDKKKEQDKRKKEEEEEKKKRPASRGSKHVRQTSWEIDRAHLPGCTCGVCPLRGVIEEVSEGGSEEGIDESSEGGSEQGAIDESSEGGSEEGEERSTERDLAGRLGPEDEYGMEFGGEGVQMFQYYLPSPMSARSRHEGSFVEDYMKFFIEPFEVCAGSISSLSSSYVSCEEMGLQRTIVMVKPPAVQYKEVIFRVIFEAGFQILGTRVIHLTPEQVAEVYAKFYGSPAFVQLVVTMSDAPILVICISALNVIKRWLKIIGPDGSLRAEWFYPLSMRKLFGLIDIHSDYIHGSENLQDSNKENRYFFPDSILEPILSEEDKVTDYFNLNINKTLVAACTEVVKKRPADPIIFVADYLLYNNPFQPRLPRDIALTPT